MSAETPRTAESDGMALIRAERQRQIEAEGYTPAHDREHGAADLTRAAAAYRFGERASWPWRDGWKPKDHLSNLIRSGALYLAADEARQSTGTAVLHVAEEIDGILAKAREVLTTPPEGPGS